ncbi:hypothetical protein [Crossiella sp. CA198]|uniref:hypothetical protein n=1 Tax=Crossiella sp. CA198 TaxID=3455607 RepID=UPI003F8D2ABD
MERTALRVAACRAVIGSVAYLVLTLVPGFGFPVVAPLAGVVRLWVLGLGISWWRQSAGSVTGRQSTGVDRTIALEVSP